MLSDETKRKNYDAYGMGSDPFSSGADPNQENRSATGRWQTNQSSSRGYEDYRAQVDPEELFRRIFGDAFNRAGFANHDWMDEPEQNIYGREGISQVNTISD